jgi:hypothetical protein
VLFSISTRYTGSIGWHKHWVDFIKSYGLSRGIHPILTNQLESPNFSPAYTDLISMTNNQTGGSRNWRSNRPVVNHKTGPKFERDNERDAARKAWWSVFVNGGHTSDDSHDGDDPADQHNSPGTLQARAQIRHFRNFIERLPYNTMVPSFVAKSNIVDQGEARVRLGDIYVVYLKDGGSVAVDLTDAAGTLQTEWYNPRTGDLSARPDVLGGSRINFTSPFSGDAVLLVFAPGALNKAAPAGRRSESRR